MACLPLPDVTLPTLPSPLTLDPPALDPVTVGAEFCCKLASFTTPTYAPFGPAVLNPAVIATINTNLALVQAYLDALPLNCPRE